MSDEKPKPKRGRKAAAVDEEEGAGAVVGVNETKSEVKGQSLGTLDNPKPGQRYLTPSPGDGTRVFYETLLEQKPNSKMAQEWCLAYGALNEAQASALFKKVQKLKQ